MDPAILVAFPHPGHGGQGGVNVAVTAITIAVKCPPINPYHGGELNHLAVRDLLVEMSHAACTMNNAICDAICAVCESPTDPPLTVEDQPTHARPIPPIGTPIMPSN